jgi:hypothetical protein
MNGVNRVVDRFSDFMAETMEKWQRAFPAGLRNMATILLGTRVSRVSGQRVPGESCEDQEWR